MDEDIKQFYVVDTYFFDVDDQMIRHESDLIESSSGASHALSKAKKLMKDKIREMDMYYEFKISQIVPVLAYTTDPGVPEEDKLQVF